MKKKEYTLFSHRGGVNRKTCLRRAILSVLTVGIFGLSSMVGSVYAEVDSQTIPENNVITSTDKAKATAESLNANVTGKDNTVTNSKEAVIVGDKNVVTDETGRVASDYSRIIGSNNTVKGSKGQLVFGDDNEIIGRDKGTTSPTRPDNQVDITIGRGNILQGADTWRPNKDSRLTVIGNNNRGVYELGSAAGIISGIVIGDNQNIDEIDQSIVIGSLSAEEQKATYGEGGEHEEVNTVSKYSTIIGYHSTNVGGGNIVVGNRSRAGGGFNIITGHRSTIGNPYEGNTNFLAMGVKGGEFSNIYGSFNRIDDKGGSETIDGIASTIQGSMNVTTRATGAMLIGTGNTITNSFFKFDDAMGNKLFGATYGSVYYIENKDTLAAGNNLEIYYDDVRSYINDYMTEGSGAVSIVGNSNKADYAIRSQIIGNANAVTGTETAISSLNTVSGFGNKAESISRSSIIGTGNELKGGENNVIIGDYHKLKDGKRNVILGSMETKEEIIEKVAKSALPSPIGKDAKYTIKEYNPLIDHTKDIEEAVMLGYNTDVSQNGGVALGANSIASTKAGIAGYDPITKEASTATEKEWKSTWAAVSVGDGTNTRQITGVAAGTADTDAVNVAQLKKAMENAGGGSGTGGTPISIIAGDGIKVAHEGSTYTISSTVTGGAGGSGGPLKFADDTGTEATVNTNETLTIKGDTKNISTKIDGKTLSVKLNDDISVNTIKAKTSVSVENGPSMTANGIDANSKKITHVADGTEKGDAVNYGQLQAVEGRVDTNTQVITSIGSHVDRLDSRMNKVGAGAAALAALHPLEFDSDDKWNFAVGYGNYKDANSIAMGAFYRPNGNTMFSVGTNFGNGENMVNAGVSFKFGQGSNLASRPAMAKKMVALEETVQEQKETIDTLKEKMAALEELVKRQSEVIANMTK